MRFLAAFLAIASIAALAASSLAATDPARLPLGDGQTATKPARGKVVACPKTFLAANSGASKDGPWIAGDGTWNSTTKPVVAGNVAWPKATFSARVKEGKRTIASRGLPRGHRTGTFPIAASDPAHQFDANPNRIAATAVSVTLPEVPKRATKPGCL